MFCWLSVLPSILPTVCGFDNWRPKNSLITCRSKTPISAAGVVTRQWLGGLRRVCWLLVVMWVVQGLNSYLGLAFNDLGIYPREWWSLPGVVLWPFLHGGIAHLLMNSLALLMLGFFVALRGGGVFYKASLLIVVLGGLGVWMIGRPAYHIGASGLAFGYFGFLVAVAFYEKRASSLLVAGLVLFYYSGMIFG